MVIYEANTAARLAEIEDLEGMPQDEFVRQAVGVWSRIKAEERAVLGFYALSLVAGRARIQ